MIANGYFLRLVAERNNIVGTDLILVNACADRLEEADRREAALRDFLGEETYFVQAAREGRYDERSDELRADLDRRARGLR